MGLAKVVQEQMNMSKLRKKAKGLDITPGQMKKVELIHNIQMAEGCTPCYGTTDGECAQTDCCFIHDCLKV